MVSMERTPADKKEIIEDSGPILPTISDYPYGLCISFCEDELEKLNLDSEDVSIGDMIHLVCMAEVTSISRNANQNGDSCRLELQITHIAAEDEDTEDEEEEKPLSKLYKK